jgi:serine O-acetyltransferase
MDWRAMFDNIKEDYQTHGRTFWNRAYWAMLTYRFGRWSLGLKSRPMQWFTGKIYGALYLWTEVITGVHMPREITMGRRFHIVHADGAISIHPDAVLGNDVGVMHNVTIGTNMSSEVPVIGNDVFIGVGAAILGGVKIGDGARIAANSLVISDVPPGCVAMGVPARVWKNFSDENRTTTVRSSRETAAMPPQPPASQEAAPRT